MNDDTLKGRRAMDQVLRHADPDGYTVEYRDGKITVAKGGRSAALEPGKVLDPVPAPYAKALRRQGLDPAGFVYVAGSSNPVRRSALPLLLAAFADRERRRQAAEAEREARLVAAVPGLAELRAALEAEDRCDRAFGRMMADEGNDGARPPAVPAVRAADVAARFPRAALYLKAEDYSLASHHLKAAAGQDAMALLEAGGEEDGARRLLDNWLPAEAAWN